MIAYELRQIRSASVSADNNVSLRILELAAKIKSELSKQDHPLIDQIISGKMKSLKNSKNIFIASDVSHCER